MSPIQTPQLLPDFKVRLSPPDISDWIAGTGGIPGIVTRDSGVAGPHVALMSLVHGNELGGAIVLDRLLRAGLVPVRGRLTFAFVNLEGFHRFDPLRPTVSRFVDEDLNRVWDESVLDSARHSIELDRARQIRPLVDSVDVLLDLHSMLWPSEALILSGAPDKGRSLAVAIGTPDLVIADHGHVNGRRLIDYRRFSSPATPYAGILVEAGQHWEQATVDTMMASVAGLLRHLGVVDSTAPLPSAPAPGPVRVATVTSAVTAMTSQFNFVTHYQGGDIVEKRNTLIAIDGDVEIRTPYDNCMLVMPGLRPGRGHTAVRLARIEAYRRSAES